MQNRKHMSVPGKNLIISTMFSVLTLTYSALPVLPSTNEFEGYSKSFVLPINATLPKNKKLYLNVTVPGNFKMIGNSGQTWELMPKTDVDPYKWSEMLVVSTYIGKRANAKQVVAFIKAGMLRVDKNAQVLEESVEDHGLYSAAHILIAYHVRNRHELMFGKYFSGPFDCSGFQYSIELKDTMSQADAQKKIDEFVQKNTGVVQL